ncbi:hypothetical protein IWW34DRAFT_582177, partial [Fusarium oxysporum f. sp. albedinis]
MQKDNNDPSGTRNLIDEVSVLISKFFNLMLSSEDDLQGRAALPIKLLRTML